MTSDIHAITRRLAGQDPAMKQVRNALIERGVSIREATARAAQITGQPARRRPAPGGRMLAEAIAAEVSRQIAIRKAAKRAARESTPPPRRLTEAETGTALRETSNGELAGVAGVALTTAGRSPFRASPGPARTTAQVRAEQALEAAASPSGMNLSAMTSEQLREHLGRTLTMVSDVAGYGSPFLTDRASRG